MRIEQKIILRKEFINYYNKKYGITLDKKVYLKEILNKDRLFPYRVLDLKSGKLFKIGKEDIDYTKTVELSYITKSDQDILNSESIIDKFKKYFGY